MYVCVCVCVCVFVCGEGGSIFSFLFVLPLSPPASSFYFFMHLGAHKYMRNIFFFPLAQAWPALVQDQLPRAATRL